MNLTDLIKQIVPVFVVAPSARNGITLVQRLLNSSRQIVIYGENNIFMDQFPAMVHAAVHAHTENGEELEASRQKFFSETTEYWTSNLWPSTEQNMLLMFDAFNRFVGMYQQCTQEHGQTRWGIKNPMVSPNMIDRLHAVLLKARFIFLHRNLYDVVRSAKARKFIETPEARDRFITNWRKNMEAVLDKDRPHVMVVKHEELVARPAESIAAIERFASVQGIDPKVLGQKINTFVGPESAGMSPTGYIEPSALDEQDTQAIERLAGDLLEQLGYRDAAV